MWFLITNYGNSFFKFYGESLSYDKNGNMTSDGNKGIVSISYNHMNLPVQINFFNGTDKIEYLYRADGTKLQKKATYSAPQLAGGVGIKTMDYLTGFHYDGAVLKFFPTAEGYVNYTSGQYNYVYNYTDHLGNVRLSYGLEPRSGGTKIIEENHYYPFGMKHTNYNVDRYSFQKIDSGLVLKAAPSGPSIVFNYDYKFQGQERQDELGLNWGSFKWRNYDYAIGRFMNIDPLTEQYNTWSPYAFSGNRVIDSRELEGLEPHSVHKTLQEASRNFSTQYNGYSITNSVEVSTQFYQNADGNFSYGTPKEFGAGLSDPTQTTDIPDGAAIVGAGHTHGSDDNFNIVQNPESSGNPMLNPKGITLDRIKKDNLQVQNGSNAPSGTDKDIAKSNAASNPSYKADYVYTPSGLVYSAKVNPQTGKVEYSINYNLSQTNPSDPNSNMRINQVAPTTTPQVPPQQGTLLDDTKK